MDNFDSVGQPTSVCDMTSAEFRRDFSHSSLPHHFKFGCHSDDDPDEVDRLTDAESERGGQVTLDSDRPSYPGEECDADDRTRVPVFTVGDSVLVNGPMSVMDPELDEHSARSGARRGAEKTDGSRRSGSDRWDAKANGRSMDDSPDQEAGSADSEVKDNDRACQRSASLTDGKLPTIDEDGSLSQDVDVDCSADQRPERDHPDDRLPDVAFRSGFDRRLRVDVQTINGVSPAPDGDVSLAHQDELIQGRSADLGDGSLDLEMSASCYPARRRYNKASLRTSLPATASSGSSCLSRSVKTAPSTPDSESHRPQPRHAESTSHLEMSAIYGSRSAVKGMENCGNVKPPDKKSTASMSKSRDEKFHKLFKHIPEVEHVLKSYLCAYVGDILLQGYFYILPSYFCFYAKILGHEKQLAIPVSEVLNITREKTALIIPNAIGILTKKDKYVFGSLMSRDSTYRLMCSVWRKKIPNAQVTEFKASDSDSSTGQDYIVARDDLSSMDEEALASSASGSDLSEGSPWEVCGLPMIEHDAECSRVVSDAKTSDVASSEASLCNGALRGKSGDLDQLDSATHRHRQQSVKTNKPKAKQHGSPSVSTTGCLCSISRTKALLVICLVISVFLVLLAAFMSYKIILLQTQIDTTIRLLDPSVSKYIHSQKLYGNLYHLNDRYHTSTIERFHNILEANIEILSQVHASLFSLHKTSNLSGGHDSCPGSDGYCKDDS